MEEREVECGKWGVKYGKKDAGKEKKVGKGKDGKMPATTPSDGGM